VGSNPIGSTNIFAHHGRIEVILRGWWARPGNTGKVVGSNPIGSTKSNHGGDTVSTGAVTTRRHAGRHLPATGWKTITANTELALAA